MITPELHIEPRAASSCVRFLESMRSRYVQALTGTPIIGKKPLNLAHRGGTNAEAHRRYLKANSHQEAAFNADVEAGRVIPGID